MREGLRAGQVVGEGRVEEGGGVRGSEASRRSARGDQAAVCVHIDTQSSGFGSDEAHFALQTGVECRAAEATLFLVSEQCPGQVRRKLELGLAVPEPDVCRLGQRLDVTHVLV